MTQHVNDHMMNVVGPAINDGLAAYFKGDPLDPSDPEITVGYRFTDATLTPVKGPALTFARAGIAQVRDRYRILRELPADVPRFPGAIYTVNLIPQSEDLNQTPWSPLRVTVAADAGTPPTGITNVWKMTETAVLETHGMRSLGKPRNAIQCKVKPAERTKFDIFPGAPYQLGFDLAAGQILAPNTNTNGRITPLNDGWFLCEIWPVDPNVVWAGDAQFRLLDDAGLQQYTGDGVSGMFITGCQAELKSSTVPEPSAYVRSLAVFGVAVEGPALGVQVEGASENLEFRSADIAGWTLSSCLATVGTKIAPDGGKMTRVATDTVGGATGNVYAQDSAIAFVAGEEVTVSCFFAPDQTDWVLLRFGNYPIDADCYFNVRTGEAGTQGAAVLRASAVNVGDGIYRCTYTFTADVTDLAGNIRFHLAAADNNPTLTRDGLTSVFAWGMQVEKQSNATSYIPTAGAAASRVAETLIPTLTPVEGINSLAGTVYMRFAGIEFSAVPYIWNVDDGSNANRFYSNVNIPSNWLRFTSITDAVNEINMNVGPPVNDGQNRVAAAWGFDDCAQYLNGVANGVDATFDPPAAVPMIRAHLGGNAAGNQANIIIAEFAISSVRKPDSYLQSVTTP